MTLERILIGIFIIIGIVLIIAGVIAGMTGAILLPFAIFLVIGGIALIIITIVIAFIII
jgi:hypothetical protein